MALSLNPQAAEVTTYEDGQQTQGLAAYIVPGAFMVLFYVVFFFSIGYAMTSVAEEKENRAIEMVLSYVRPRTLMFGKLFSVALIALTQLVFFAVVAAVAYAVAQALGNELTLPVDLDNLVFALQPILFGALYLLWGFLLFIALMLATGAAFPSAKEANSFLGFFYILVVLPFISGGIISQSSEALITQFATYFPLTAAPTLLIRNTFGTISLTESLLGLGVLIISTFAAIWLAGRLFKLGTLNFSSRVKLRSVFRRG